MLPNLRQLTVAQAVAALGQWLRTLPQLLLLRHIRSLELGILVSTVLVGGLLIVRLLYSAPASSTNLGQKSLALPTAELETVLQWAAARQDEGGRLPSLENRAYFETTPPGNP